MSQCACGIDVHAHIVPHDIPTYLQACAVFPALHEAVAASPTETAHKKFYDALVFDGPTLARLVAQFGSTQLMIGTDSPFNFHDSTPGDRIRTTLDDRAVRDALLHRNARRFPDLPA